MKNKLAKIEDVLDRVNKNESGLFSKEPELIMILDANISWIIGDDMIHISEFVLAKVKGRIPELKGHIEITDQIILMIPVLLKSPREILKDTRFDNKYLFLISNPFIEIVIEVRRIESGKTEINTFHKISIQEIKRLERKFPVVL